jgi:leader peptidase (prepilin peptidase)/N-methyltransferase
LTRGRPRWLGAAVLVTPLQRWAVLVHSVPPEQPWRTGCPYCEAPLEPLAGPAGRCRACGRRIGPAPYVVEAATLVAAALVAVAAVGGGWSAWAVIAAAGWAAAAVPLSFVDLAVHRLPDRLTLPAAGWALAWLGLDAAVAGGSAWVRAVVAGVACALGFAAVTLVAGSRGGYGLGDAKLMLGAGALLGWLGWTAVLAGLLLAFLASGLVATALLVTRRVTRRDTLPFGPFLAAGTLVTLAWVGVSGAG